MSKIERLPQVVQQGAADKDSREGASVLGAHVISLARRLIDSKNDGSGRDLTKLVSTKFSGQGSTSGAAVPKIRTGIFAPSKLGTANERDAAMISTRKIRRKPALPQQQVRPGKSKLNGKAKAAFQDDLQRTSRCEATNYSSAIPCDANGVRKPLKYYVHSGNNSELIRHHFRQRRDWAPTKSPWELSAMNGGSGLQKISELCGNMDFMWCQYKSWMGPYNNYDTGPGGRGCIVNHLSNNTTLTYKWKLDQSLAQSGALDVAPETLVVWTDFLGVLDQVARSKLEEFSSGKSDQIFIVKPGAATNRGFGIKVMRGTEKVVQDIEAASSKESEQKKKKLKRPWVIQKYIENPLLVKGRKFDIRCYLLIVHNNDPSTNNKLRHKHDNSNNQQDDTNQDPVETELEYKVFLHSQAYLRTSCNKFSLRNLEDRVTHLTNDFVQNKCKNYGKGESGNKLSLNDFADILDRSHGPGAGNWVEDVCWPTITDICKRVARAGIAAGMHDNKHKSKAFELFGLDFMVEHGEKKSTSVDDLRLRLIEVNDNPCLSQVCPLLHTVISKVVEDTMEIVLDCNFSAQPKPKKPTNMFARLF